jgi:hypothetical protein
MGSSKNVGNARSAYINAQLARSMNGTASGVSRSELMLLFVCARRGTSRKKIKVAISAIEYAERAQTTLTTVLPAWGIGN